MTTIDDLSRAVQATYDIETHAAAVDVVRATVDQISADAELWDADARELTAAGVEVASEAIAASYAQGLHGTAGVCLLELLESAAVRITEARTALEEAIEERDDLIRAALRTALPREQIRQAAGVTRDRLYQIRDGRR